MENLSKENFWDDLHEKCPDAVEHFCKWIDEYKKEVGWNKLFGNQERGPFHDDVKFHDIPFEMQNGIIARYELELFNYTGGKGKANYETIGGQYKQQVRALFADLQKKIIQRKEKMN